MPPQMATPPRRPQMATPPQVAMPPRLGRPLNQTLTSLIIPTACRSSASFKPVARLMQNGCLTSQKLLERSLLAWPKTAGAS